ncbi:site-specific integrase [Hymenobacter aquaticus]|uniref:Site-specific integrase n=1 Tax=Hymenobacter aquaticus TaxID=1867101 RepID=A0A4Z0Q409_9BACT|nr:site-specific integrase [Hymenobacter aquaticus]TGE24760.1 site-specific integrase [Hymenobacter aquaticus]
MSRTTDSKEGTATVKVVYFTGKVLANGSHPFLIRITKNRKQLYRSTGLSLHPKYWNEEKNEIRRSWPGDAKALWKKLNDKAAAYEAAADALATQDTQHDAQTVLRKANEARLQSRRIKLVAYFDELIADLTAAAQLGNARVYRDARNQLARFIESEYPGENDVPFDRVSVAFCLEWEQAMRATGVEETSLSVRFRTLRAVFNKAIAVGAAKAEHYPFARTRTEQHKFSVSKFDVTTRKRALPREALRQLELLQPTTRRQQLAKDAFLFSFYCGGINFVDLAQLRWQDLKDKDPATGHPLRLEYDRQKTGGKFSLKLLAPAAAIVATYSPITKAGPSSYIFPFLDVHKHKTPAQRQRQLHTVLGWVNRLLKALGQQAGIATPLTTYVARHSFATTLKLKGANTALISQAMGHKSQAITEIYLDSFGSELIDSALEDLL